MLRGRAVWIAAGVTCLASGAFTAQAQEVSQRLYLRHAGGGRPGVLLRAALSHPHLVLRSDSVLRLRRDMVFDRTVIIVGGDATVASTVRGDVIVVGGDLFIHPGASIDGRAVAIGGGVYGSTLAEVRGGLEAFRDETFDVEARADGLALSYRRIGWRPAARFGWPLLFGLRLPAYTRVDGLSIPFGPRATLDSGRIEIDPLVVYRSDLGEVDPLLIASRTGRFTRIELRAGRITATNDAWIRSELANSYTTLVAGKDMRNYYRADRAELQFDRLWERSATTYTATLGALTERSWSVAAGGPWSAFGRRSLKGMLRPNPEVEGGRITSALGGARGEWDRHGVKLRLGAIAEVALDAPAAKHFTQAVADGSVQFPTFGTQTFDLEIHSVTTVGDTAPGQRFAYLGGPSTLPTFEILQFGGDQLFFMESRYTIPFERVRLGFLGSPVIVLRHMLGSAGVDKLPPLEQNVGVRLGIGFVRADFTIEPVSGVSRFSAGLAVSR